MTPEFDRVLQIGILRSCRCAEAAWIIPLRLTLMPKRHHKGGRYNMGSQWNSEDCATSSRWLMLADFGARRRCSMSRSRR